MNKFDLISAVADRADLPRAKAADAVEAVLGAITGALRNNEDVRLVGFGSFGLAARKPTIGRDPRTGARLSIPASVSVRFKPGKGLKDAVSQKTDATR